MTAVFPDSGVPAYEAKNTILDPNTVNCSELWYSTSRCQPRFDPAAANAMLSELINAVNCAGIAYDCTKLNNLCTAIEYMIQHGDSNCLYLAGGTTDYYGGLNPHLQAYPGNCCMLLKVIPNVTNSGPVRINIDNLGYLPVLRNDGLPLEPGDFRGGVPFIMVYCNGRFYIPGLSASQVPIIVKGGVDIWIRTDGNDVTGDGSANTPDKAFRTIAGAWGRVGSRYAATPLFSMNFKLGNPGTYAGAILGPFGGNVSVGGAGGGTRSDYRLSSVDFGNNVWGNLFFNNMSIHVYNLTFVRDVAPPLSGSICRVSGGSSAMIGECDWDSTVANPNSEFVTIYLSSQIGMLGGTYNFYGRNLALGALFNANSSSSWVGSWTILGSTFNFVDCPIQANGAAMVSSALGIVSWNSSYINSYNVTGRQYIVSGNSVMYMNGLTPPGTLPGVVSSGGQFGA